MNSEPNSYLSQNTPQWMRDMFEELSDMFEELFPDADKLNLEKMQQRLDERERPPIAASEQPSSRYVTKLMPPPPPQGQNRAK
jgi:hypothetical protein